MDEYLIGIRLRTTMTADDYRIADDVQVHVGDVVVVEGQGGTATGEVRRPRRPIPEFKRDRTFPRVVRLATSGEAREWRERRTREAEGIVTSQQLARARGLAMKVVDVEMAPGLRRVTVYFNADE